MGKLRIRELRVEWEETVSSDKAHEQPIAHKTFISEQMFYAQNLSRKMEMRCGKLSKKCNVELKTMSDFQILECQKKYERIGLRDAWNLWYGNIIFKNSGFMWGWSRYNVGKPE